MQVPGRIRVVLDFHDISLSVATAILIDKNGHIT
jgi:hypothetical protein